MEVKVDNGIKKLKACSGKSNQARLDCFFKPGAVKTSSTKPKDAVPPKKIMVAGKSWSGKK